MTLDHVRTLSGGINQTGVRAYNERLILSILQRNGGLPGSDLARRTRSIIANGFRDPAEA